MGERFIDISPGSSDTLLDMSGPAQGYYDTGISEVMGMMGQVIVEMRELISLFHEAAGSDEGEPPLVKIVNDMEKITNDLREMTEDNKDRMERTVEDLSVASGRLREFVERNESKLDTIVDNLDKSSGTFKETGANIDSISAAVKELVNDLKKGEGTLGRAMTDEELYERLLRTTANLDSLITDLKENPKKYIHFSIF
jgi:phospholipid/cholesterol/gamma-HCH transport system substrate-binding protein